MLTQEKIRATINCCPSIPYGLCHSWDRFNDTATIEVKTSKYNWKRTDKTKSTMGSFTMYAKDDHLELWNVRISSRHQGKGYGQQMIREAIEMTNGVEVVLYVKKHNKTAIHVYEKCGFVIVEEDGQCQTNDMLKMVHPGQKFTFENRPNGICGYWGESKVLI